jgi:hypothetical protein
MPFIVIVIGALIAIAAFNETHGDLAKALESDIPGYFKWGIAIAAILGLGYIPGFDKPSRWLMALVALVVVLTNWQQMIDGFTQFAQADPTAGSGGQDPTTAYVTSAGQGGTPTATQIAGESGAAGGGGGTQVAGGSTPSFNPLNPNSYIGLAAGFGGLA